MAETAKVIDEATDIVTTPEIDATIPAEVTPPANPRLDRIKKLGFDGVEDEAEAFDRLAEAYERESNRTTELAEQVQAAIEEMRLLKGGVNSVQKPKTETGDNWWSPPEVDLALLQSYRQADGSWKPGTPEDVKAAEVSVQRYYDKWANDLVRRPNEILPKIIRKEAEKIVAEMFGRDKAQYQEQTAREKVTAENPWLFEKDPLSGKVDTNRLSAEGDLLNQHLVYALNKGFDFTDAWDYAHSKHQLAKLAANKTTTTEDVNQVNEQKKKELLARASNANGNRTGSLPTATSTHKTQNRHLSAGERFAAQAKKDGVSF